MEDILEQVKLFDLKTLREKLIENGIKVGPIAPSTAFLFQKRLAKHLFQLQGGVVEEKEQQTGVVLQVQNETSKSEAAVVGKVHQSDVFYAVCLPETVDNSIDTNGKNRKQSV